MYLVANSIDQVEIQNKLSKILNIDQVKILKLRYQTNLDWNCVCD
jgi:hypothetical protein